MGALTITASYDASVTSKNGGNATDQAIYTGYVSAVASSIAYFQNHFTTIGTTDVNVNIVFGFGSVTGPAGTTVLNTPGGASGTAVSSVSVLTWSDFSTLMTGAVAAPNVSTLQRTAWNKIVPQGTSTADPTSGTGSFLVSPAQNKLLDPSYASAAGFSAAAIDGQSVLNSTMEWNWTQTNFTANQQDAIATDEHEISELLGRTMGGGVNNRYQLEDFYDYTAAGNPTIGSAQANAVAVGGAAGQLKLTVTPANTTAPNAQTYFSYDGTTVGLAFTVPPGTSDIADWSNGGNDAYGSSADGVISPISATDGLVVQALGLVACFAVGTRIATPGGWVDVDALAIGDLVTVLSGAARAVKWIGRRDYATPHRGIAPVRIAAGALGDGVPARDLYVSPMHAMYLDGMLIPAGELVNGASIARAWEMTPVQYRHVELDCHDIIFAEGAATESFVDCDSREMFTNQAEFGRLYPADQSPRWLFCAPRVEAGPGLEQVRRRIEARCGLEARVRPPVALLGHLDGGDPWRLHGWACEPERPDLPVTLELLLNGGVIARVEANQFRADLAAAGIGSGRHGFDVRLSRKLPPRALLRARRVGDGHELVGSPLLVLEDA